MSCKVCKHVSRIHIERLLNAGRPVREIADLFPGISYRTIYRHLEKCMKDENQLISSSENLPETSTFKEKIKNSSIENEDIISAKDICDTLLDIDSDAKELYLLEKKDGKYAEANEKLKTRLEVQKIVIDMAQMAILVKKEPAQPSNKEPKEAETIPTELEDILGS